VTRPYDGGPIPPPPDLPERPRRVLLIRLSARGDVLFALPFAERVKARWPGVEVDWVVEGPSSDMVEGHPAVDHLVVWDRVRWKRLLRSGRLIRVAREALALRRRLRERRYDLVVDLHGMLRSGLLARLTGAPVRVGYDAKEGSSLMYTHRFPGWTDVDRMGGDFRDVADWMGLDASGWRLDAPLSGHARAEAREHLAARGVDDRYLVAIPHTTRPQKHLDEARWGPLIDALHARTGLPVVMLGGPGDREATDRIVRGVASGALVDLVGGTSLGAAAAVVADAALVVGVDTGLTHVAHYHDRPTVCLFGPAAYVVPPTEVTRIIRHDELECVRCMVRGPGPTCDGAWWCMDRITVDEVMGHVDDLLEGRPDPRPPARS
jgi:heptosyltransferase-1